MRGNNMANIGNNSKNENRRVPSEIFERVSSYFMKDYAQILRESIYYVLKKTGLQNSFFSEAINPTHVQQSNQRSNQEPKPILTIAKGNRSNNNNLVDETSYNNFNDVDKLACFDVQGLLKSFVHLYPEQNNSRISFDLIFLSTTMNVRYVDNNTKNKFRNLIHKNINNRNSYFGHTSKHVENKITVNLVEEIISDMLAVTEFLKCNAKIADKIELLKSKSNRLIAELKNPMSVKKICDSYFEKYSDEISRELVEKSLKYFNCVIDNNVIYVEYVDLLLEGLKEREDNRKTLSQLVEIRKARKMIYRKTAYKGGMMTEMQFRYFLDGYITVLSRDFVFADQFYKLMADYIIPLYKKIGKKIIIPFSIVSELEDRCNRHKNFVFAEESIVEKARAILALLKSMKESGILLSFKISSDVEYNDKTLCDSLSLYPELNFCILTLNSEFLNVTECKNTENILIGKFMISGKFRLYSDSIPVFIDNSNFDSMSVSEESVDNNYYYDDGSVIEIRNEIASGGEGRICLTSEKGLVAKIFRDSNIAEAKFEKMKYMVENNPSISELCWPEKLLYNSEKRFAGYTMKRFSGKELALTVLKINRTGVCNRYLREWKRKDLAVTCLNIAKIEESLQKKGNKILVGDVNPRNIMIDIENGGTISFIDCDSYQTGDFKCGVGMAEYISPYILRNFGRKVDLKKIARKVDDENYAFAVLFFQILMLGTHPMNVSHCNNDVLKATENLRFIFPFEDISQPETKVYGTCSVIWHNMPYYLKKAFAQTFTANELYSMSEWVELFEKYICAIDRGEEDNQLFPDKFKAEFDEYDNGLYVDIKCDICGRETNMHRDEYKKLIGNGQLIYCNCCAPSIEEWKRKGNYVRCTCDSCSRIFQMPAIDAMTLKYKNKKTLCNKCQK